MKRIWNIQQRYSHSSEWCYFFTDLPTKELNDTQMIFRLTNLANPRVIGRVRRIIYKAVQR